MSSKDHFSWLRVGVVAIALGMALPLAAQTAADDAAATADPTAADAADATAAAEATAAESADGKPANKRDDRNATELNTVIVTVERREQALQDYAGTAQAFSQDELRDLGINNELRNLQALVPGLNINNQEGNVEIFIRGVGSANNTELGDPGAAPHVNGNYIARPRGLGAMFYDLERVEINKGPQGTLRGRNALAGTLNIVTKKPELGVTGGYAQGEVSNRDGRGYEGAYNVEVGESSALRFSAYHQYKGTSFNNAGAADYLRPAGIQDEIAGRVSFLSQPTDELSIFIMGDYGHEGGTGYPGANIYGAARAGFEPDDYNERNVIYRGNQGQLDSANWGVQTNVSYDFNFATLEYNGSYRDVDFEQENASSDGVLWPGRDVSPTGEDYDIYSNVFWQTRSQSYTHELRLSSADDVRLHWTTGAFYFKEDQSVGFLSVADKGYCCYSGTEFTMPDVNGESWAGFADGVFDVTDSFRIKAGVRYTDESKSRYGIGGNWALVLGGSDFACCFATRLGTEGFVPALLDRPNFNLVGIDTPAEMAAFLIQGILRAGARDTLIQQLAGIPDGSRPGGTCVVRPDTTNGFITCPGNGQHSYANITIPSIQAGSSSFDYTDWRTGFEYDFDPEHLVYGTVSTGHKAGGFNDSFDVDVVPETFDPEKLLVFELGSKNEFDFRGRPATFNVSGFYYDYTNQVFQDLTTIAIDQNGNATGFSLVNRNVGESRLYGLEAESTLRLGDGFTLDLNALYLDTEITEGVVADVRSQNFGAGGITSSIDLKGNELPLTSKYTLNARLGRAFPMFNGTFDWQTLFSYRSSYFLTQFNDRDVTFISDTAGTVDRVEDALTAGFPDEEDGNLQINLGWGYSAASGNWRLEGWVTNLLDNDVSQKALVGSGIDVRFLNDARSYGIRLRAYF